MQGLCALCDIPVLVGDAPLIISTGRRQQRRGQRLGQRNIAVTFWTDNDWFAHEYAPRIAFEAVARLLRISGAYRMFMYCSRRMCGGCSLGDNQGFLDTNRHFTCVCLIVPKRRQSPRARSVWQMVGH
jgi:hypothetical protein